jgi:rubrerythrin
MELDRFLEVSAKVRTDDLDWNEARRVGLTADERFIITYFADIEGQTIVYLRDLLQTSAALDPEVVAFLSMWIYEEYFHSRALSQLLEICGCPLGADRVERVRAASQLSEVIEAAAATLASKIFARDFPAVHMSWGATQELTTVLGYEALARNTGNAVLRELCDRIAKQERRHFAWYFNSARERLARSQAARRLARFALWKFWSPVGAGVKRETEGKRLLVLLFGQELEAISSRIDEKIGMLPGLAGFDRMRRYVGSIPATMRECAPQWAPARRAA